MDLGHLRENRSHGTPEFPAGLYAMEEQTGDPLLESHWHEEAELFFVTRGRTRFRVGLAEYELEEGDGVFVAGGELHGASQLGEAACSYRAVVFDMDWLIDAKDGISARFLQPVRSGRIALLNPIEAAAPWGRRVADRAEALFALEHDADPAREMRFKAGLYMLLAEFWTEGRWSGGTSSAPAEARAVERLKTALTHVERHFGRKLTVRELAGVAGMSEGHFSRLFKSYMRKTPIEHVNHFRLRHAARRLAEDELTVGEAAGEAGFDNFSYFSKLFREHFGCSPSAYRRKARGSGR